MSNYFHTERDPEITKDGGNTEFSNGMSIEILRLPQPEPNLGHNLLEMSLYTAFEWVHNLNTEPGVNTFRAAVQLSFSLTPTYQPIKLLGW
ncbi:MAG TPA: hypothetical protein VGY99_13455 [Candidatus Binataceae bacterium]|jgi:hypothetical protein|nr:hypothetical protein [Candidatus Binataceae bacterium]